MEPIEENRELEHAHNPLDDWLHDLSAEGELEGEGGFSLVQEKAWEKLGAFQLPFASAWVLKLVQAAVAGGADSIEVVQTRSESIFRFPEVQEFEWQNIQKLLFEVDSDSGSAAGHLAVALRALAKSTGHPFFVNFAQDSKVVWNGETFQVADSEQDQFELRVSHFVSARVLKAIQFMTGVQKALTDHCHLCPIPLSLDARPINSVANDPFLRPLSACVPLAYVTTSEIRGFPRLTLPETDWQARLPEGYRVGLATELAFASEAQCGASLVLCGFRRATKMDEQYYRVYTKSSELVWVCDGVIVARETLKVHKTVGALVIVNAHGLETDLTGFMLRRTRKFRRRRSSSLQAVLKNLSGLFSVNRLKTTGRPSIKSLMGVGGIITGVLLPPAGLVILGIRWLSIRQEHDAQAEFFEREFVELESGLDDEARGAQ